MALFVIFHSFLELLREFEAADLREQIDCLASVGDLSCSSIKLWEIAERDQLISSTKEINCVRAAYVGSTSLHGIYIHIAPQGRIILHHRTSSSSWTIYVSLCIRVNLLGSTTDGAASRHPEVSNRSIKKAIKPQAPRTSSLTSTTR
ncbi:hypothetical protein PVAP13_1NG501700 [Panicum virgatum]|uniref:Uncharacterized protein n=1 Tax=Panicum virgatum TaxID=38727 RepID=A0A8T0X7Y8_PANVG|nr:hypothetical protein PVAP13_1NG501700 [Panicum virgatum]